MSGVRLSLEAARDLCARAAVAAGARQDAAEALADAAVAGEAQGKPAVGLAHFLDYLDALEAGRLDGRAEPGISRPAPAVFLSDARGGTAHLGFARCLSDLAETARTLGLATFSQKNSYTCGELGYFTRRLAEEGLLALAATNGPALLAASDDGRPVYCTNPLSFAAPGGRGPLVIDQASSVTAFVNVRRAAATGEPIPAGWAVDREGQPTTDPAAAMEGAMLPFGGAKGANIALMVEVLAALSGASWSLDAPSFRDGSACPGTGLFVLAMNPGHFDPDFAARWTAQAERLESGYGVHIPGMAGADAARRAAAEGVLVPRAVHDRLAALSGNHTAPPRP